MVIFQMKQNTYLPFSSHIFSERCIWEKANNSKAGAWSSQSSLTKTDRDFTVAFDFNYMLSQNTWQYMKVRDRKCTSGGWFPVMCLGHSGSFKFIAQSILVRTYCTFHFLLLVVLERLLYFIYPHHWYAQIVQSYQQHFLDRKRKKNSI